MSLRLPSPGRPSPNRPLAQSSNASLPSQSPFPAKFRHSPISSFAAIDADVHLLHQFNFK